MAEEDMWGPMVQVGPGVFQLDRIASVEDTGKRAKEDRKNAGPPTAEEMAASDRHTENATIEHEMTTTVHGAKRAKRTRADAGDTAVETVSSRRDRA